MKCDKCNKMLETNRIVCDSCGFVNEEYYPFIALGLFEKNCFGAVNHNDEFDRKPILKQVFMKGCNSAFDEEKAKTLNYIDFEQDTDIYLIIHTKKPFSKTNFHMVFTNNYLYCFETAKDKYVKGNKLLLKTIDSIVFQKSGENIIIHKSDSDDFYFSLFFIEGMNSKSEKAEKAFKFVINEILTTLKSISKK